ncbi:MAG: carboxypeptidase regulatory-like domain-containing protein [Gemmatimonadota bacterium]
MKRCHPSTSLGTTARIMAATLVLPFAVQAQAVRGTVVDRANAPVSGVVTQLLDSTSRVVARQLSNSSGAFRLTAPRAGSYRIQTLRIGFAPTLSTTRVLAPGAELTERIVLAGVQVSFDTIRVVSQSACRIARDSAATTFAIWQQVRTALTAAEITTANRDINTTAVVYERSLDPRGKSVLKQGSVIRTGFVPQPWSSMSPDSLGRGGYVATDSTGATTYYAPGIDVLLSSRFLEDHCFRVTNDGTRIGMTFEPTRDRKDIPEIRGTVWIDRASLELRNMEYRYENIPPEQELAGGTMEFARLKDGAWVISRWNILMPALELRTVEVRIGRVNERRQEIHVREIVERGGNLALARRGTDTLWSRPSLAFSGLVRDSASRRPVPGAYVALQGTALAGIADSAGRFSIGGLIPGEYTVEVNTASLDSVGASHAERIRLIDSTSKLIEVESASIYASRVCGPTRLTGARAGIIVGGVKAVVDSIAVSNLPVVAEWEGAATGGSRVVTRTDSTGAFRLCGIPLNDQVSLSAESRGESTEPIAVRIPQDRLLASVQLTVDAPRGATLAGFVRADSSATRPVADAEVTLTDIGKTVTTDAKGAYRMIGIPPGEHTLSVRRIGYMPADARVTFVANARLTRNIELTRVALLDSMRVVAQSRAMRTFEEHRRTGLGTFLTREDLAKKEGQTMAAVMTQIPGVALRREGSHAFIAPNRKGPALDENRGVCYSAVYVDNVLVYSPGRLYETKEDRFDINTISPDKIEAIEMYMSPASTPNMYAGLNRSCGVVVIWTRRFTPDEKP